MFGSMEDRSDNDDKSRYLKYILVFGMIFTILQISDLALTRHVLGNPGIGELNPLYSRDWFVPFKLTMVILLMGGMYFQPVHNRRIAKNAMMLVLIMYVLINLNNLYFFLSL